MKSRELEPTKENILSSITKDLLDRNRRVWDFVQLCSVQDGKCSIALDAQWGCGKTFFVRQAEMLLNAFNDFTDSLSSEEKETVKGVFINRENIGESANIDPQVCVYYDAWANDNDIDPVLSLVYEIIKTITKDYSLNKDADFIKSGALIVDLFKGWNAERIVDFVRDQNILNELKNQKDIHTCVADFLESVLYERGNRLVLFIDELDRCKPSFAVQLLERLKHYFSNDRITFVFSVNIKELQHTVKCYYGEAFDACRYLDRFFDYVIALPPAKMERYYQEIGINDSMYVYDAVCKAVVKKYSLSLRETEKYIRMTKIAEDEKKFRSHIGFLDNNGFTFAACIIVPIIIGLRMIDVTLYNEFVDGENPDPLIELLEKESIARNMCSMLLKRTEAYESSPYDGKTVVDLSDKLREVYNAIFNNHDKLNETDIGNCSFNYQTKDAVLKIASLLSEYACYE